MAQGYIKLYRSIEDWEWIDDPVMFYFWGRILLMANWESKRWHGKEIERGSFVTTLSSLSGKLNLSVQQIRTCLNRLKAGGEIKTISTNAYTLVTICKYDDYQGCATNEQQTNNKQDNNPTTTTKEEYNTSDTKVSSYSIQENKKEIREAAERLYAMYPSRCPVSRRATGKSSKDKERLERLLKAHTEEELAYKIKRYVKECTEQDSYIKNFATFLNNLPDYSDTTNETTTKTEQKPKKASGFILSSGGLLNKLDY